MNSVVQMERQELLKELAQPIPFMWRIQSISKQKPQATCVAYIDARDVNDTLDKYCKWQNEYKEIAGNLFCGVGIKIEGEWEWRWDCGTESNTEKEKGHASDAFKRAAVKWGVGRFLYDLKIQYVKTNEAKKPNNHPYPVDERGQRIWDLTEYLNRKLSHSPIPKKNQEVPKKETTGKPKVKPELWTDKQRKTIYGFFKQRIVNENACLENKAAKATDWFVRDYASKLNLESPKEFSEQNASDLIDFITKAKKEDLVSWLKPFFEFEDSSSNELKEQIKEVEEKKTISTRAKLTLQQAVIKTLPKGEQEAILQQIQKEELDHDLFLDIAKGVIKRQEA